jgi:general secretion pathway protein G
MNRRTIKKGFTLIEILIVVIILGILAAIVIPQFTSASTEARQGNLKSQLQTLRSQIALYKLQHRDTPPPLATFWNVMTTKTDDTGVVNANAALNKYGPYYDAAVVNPLTSSSTLAAASAVGVGWEYDATTGKISGVNTDGTKFDETK